MKTKNFTSILAIGLFFISSTLCGQWNPNSNWRDSYSANGLCWCDSNFDHGISTKTVSINGTNYRVSDICDELEDHPDYRNRSGNDPIYNDIQCGNGPANDAADEEGCPGRVDEGPDGCDEIGPTWDIAWLSTRSRFGATNTDTNTDTNNGNLALDGTASQSTTAYNGSASRAIDNNTNGSYGNGSVTHTAHKNDSWWQVDLEQNSDIDQIQIFNRTDNCCTSRLSYFTVSVLNQNNSVVWTKSYSASPSPSLTINLSETGKKVKVSLSGTLSLAEVKVFGTFSNNTSTPTITPITPIDPNPGTKIVHLRKRNASNFAIDGNWDGANGQNIYLWRQNEDNINQQWIEIDRGNGYFSYQKQGTNYCIDGNSGGKNGQNVYLWTCNSNNQNQQWKKVDKGNGYVQLRKRNAQGFALDGNSGGSNGQNIKLYNSASSSQNLQWSITDITSSARLENDAEVQIPLLIAPNPATDYLNIDLSRYEGFAIDYSIHALDGSKVIQDKLPIEHENILNLDLTDFQNGMYIIYIKSGTSIPIAAKFIVKGH